MRAPRFEPVHVDLIRDSIQAQADCAIHHLQEQPNLTLDKRIEYTERLQRCRFIIRECNSTLAHQRGAA